MSQQQPNAGGGSRSYDKPLPRITPDNRPHWEAAKRHELALPRCDDCQRFYWTPGPVCPFCFGDNLSWATVSGRGTVSTFVVYHRAWFTSFKDDLPYAVVQVELEEGPRLTSNLVEIPPEDITIGMPVEVTFDDVTDEITLPKFKRRG